MGLFFIQNGRLFAQYGLSRAQCPTGPMRMHAMWKSQVDCVDIGVGNQRIISRIAAIVSRGITVRGINRKRPAKLLNMRRSATGGSHKPCPVHLFERRCKSMRNAPSAQNAPTNLTQIIT